MNFTSLFLKAKHWQLFLLTFAIPVGLQIVMMISMMSSAFAGNNPDPAQVFRFMQVYFPIIMLLYVGGLFGWFWSIGVGLQYLVPEHVKMKVTKFKIFFFSPLVYMLIILAFIIAVIANDYFNPIFLIVILPLHFYSIFCMFYCLYFVSKTIKTIELQREVSFTDFVGEFFLIWFYPVGIWIVQPKINKMVEMVEPPKIPNVGNF